MKVLKKALPVGRYLYNQHIFVADYLLDWMALVLIVCASSKCDFDENILGNQRLQGVTLFFLLK
jgi:hypothetical protein